MEMQVLREPLYAGAIGTSDPEVAFKDADYVVFLGAFPRKAGMERKDVMQKNIGIFNAQGAALSAFAKPDVKCVVVGNPANTNAAILARAAPNVPKQNISALTRLDHNRCVSMVAAKAGVPLDAIDGCIIWGNHSSTQFPDVRHATVGGIPVLEAYPEHTMFFEGEFIETVQKRGAAIIAARKLSSAASAAKAICDHLRDWVLGSGEKWVSMGVFLQEGNKYSIPSGIMYSVPCICSGGTWKMVEDLPIDEFARAKMDATAAELVEELALANDLLAATSKPTEAAAPPPAAAPTPPAPGGIWPSVPLGPPDAILGLDEAFKADGDERKVNLSVGAYRDDTGKPWVLPSVRQAEEAIVASAMNKEYLPIAGDPEFVKAAVGFAYGASSEVITEGRLAAVQSLSGTGSLRLIAEFFTRFLGKGTPVYLPTPTWANHLNVYRDAGLELRSYRYWDAAKLGLDFEGMLADLKAAPDKAVVLLHACAHNPTGIDPTPDQWRTLCAFFKGRPGLRVIIDCAYQGFASGDAEADAFAIRHFVSEGVPIALTQSFAKNFGLYGERVGAASLVCADADEAARALSQLKIVARPIYSNPPVHGARIVAKVLTDPTLEAQWRGECKTMAERIISMRTALREELTKVGSTRDWSHITSQIGMFCYTGLSKEQVAALTSDHHIYLTKEGRISMAGVNSGNVAYIAGAIHDVTSRIASPSA